MREEGPERTERESQVVPAVRMLCVMLPIAVLLPWVRHGARELRIRSSGYAPSNEGMKQLIGDD